MGKYVSTKMYKELGPCAYRQWRSDGHCSKLHGYAMSFYFEFECTTLDARNWCMDFGGLGPLKDQLESWFDHTVLVASDDPMKDHIKNLQTLGLAKVIEFENLGSEALAKALFDYVNEIFLPTYGQEFSQRVRCSKVMVSESEKNTAWYQE